MNKKIKVSHELPLCLIDKVQFDYEYCLPHLMDQYEEYKQFFLKSKAEGRYILLDNSLHELGKPYSDDRLFYWLNNLKPQEFFVPDFWENKTRSIVSAKKWIQHQINFPNTTFIAVVQAKSFVEAWECYNIYKDLGYTKIAFSYGASYYSDQVSHHPNKDLGKALGRIGVISRMFEMGIIKKSDRIHLLGCAVPQEFGWYKDFPFIESIDTSNPIMATIDEIAYSESGLYIKPKTNMNSCFEISEDKIDFNLLSHNISMFKKINNL